MRFIKLCGDDFSRYKFVRFIRKTSDATEGLWGINNDDVTLRSLQIGIVHTYGRGKFDSQF